MNQTFSAAYIVRSGGFLYLITYIMGCLSHQFCFWFRKWFVLRACACAWVVFLFLFWGCVPHPIPWSFVIYCFIVRIPNRLYIHPFPVSYLLFPHNHLSWNIPPYYNLRFRKYLFFWLLVPDFHQCLSGTLPRLFSPLVIHLSHSFTPLLLLASTVHQRYSFNGTSRACLTYFSSFYLASWAFSEATIIFLHCTVTHKLPTCLLLSFHLALTLKAR